MQGENQDFLASFQDVVADTIFIGSSRDDLLTEIRTNMWRITLSQVQCEALTTSDLLNLFVKIVENRQQQLNQVNIDHGVIFSLWFDEQALQFRFHLVSDFHERLPFGCQLNILPTPEPILDRYLQYPYHETIPWEALQEVSEVEGDPDAEEPFVLDVYQMKLSPHQPVSFW